MEVTIQGRGTDVSPEARIYLARKLSRLDRHLHQQAQGLVEVTRSGARTAGERLVVQVTITSNGALLRGEQSGPDVYQAIDAVTDILDRQIARLKDKVHRRGHATLARSLAEPVEAPEVETTEELGGLVRSKGFVVEPMSPEEAADQMEFLGHDFYVFLNTTTDRLGVIYHRRDGGYGLLDPQLP